MNVDMSESESYSLLCNKSAKSQSSGVCSKFNRQDPLCFRGSYWRRRSTAVRLYTCLRKQANFWGVRTSSNFYQIW